MNITANEPSPTAARFRRPSPSDRAEPPRRAGETTGQLIRATTVGAVVAVALIAAFVSYRHVRAVALTYGEDPINATVIPLSVDGLIVAASMTILADTRTNQSRHWLSYLMLATGSAASLAANVMHADPTVPARVVAAWPSAALIGSYELLMRQVRPRRIELAGAPMARRPSPTGLPAGAPWTPTKKERLRLLLAEQVAPDDPRTVYALARDLAPQIGLHPGTARRYLPGLIAERARAQEPGPPPIASGQRPRPPKDRR